MHTNQTVEFVREKVRKIRVIFPSKTKYWEKKKPTCKKTKHVMLC